MKWSLPQDAYYDIDGVIADTYPHLFKYCGLEVPLITEYGDPRFLPLLKQVENDDEFWLSIPVLHRPKRKPKAYLTHRVQPSCLTSYWLAKNKIHYAPVITLKNGEDKADYMTEGSYLVDDKPEVFNSINSGKRFIICYLMDHTYNRHIETDLRVTSLKGL